MIRDWLNPYLPDSDLLDLIEFEMPQERMHPWPAQQVRGGKFPNDECVVKEHEYEGLPGIFEPPIKKLVGTLF